MNDYECSCGMPILPTEGYPRPYSAEWRVIHKVVHMIAYPGLEKIKVPDLRCARDEFGRLDTMRGMAGR